MGPGRDHLGNAIYDPHSTELRPALAARSFTDAGVVGEHVGESDPRGLAGKAAVLPVNALLVGRRSKLPVHLHVHSECFPEALDADGFVQVRDGPGWGSSMTWTLFRVQVWG